MTIDAATLASYITLSASGGDGASESLYAGESTFGSILAEAIAQNATEVQTQTDGSSPQLFDKENMLSILYLLMGSGLGGKGQTLGLLAESLGKAMYGGSSAAVTSEQANNIYRMFANGASGTSGTARSAADEAITPVAASKAATPAVVSTVSDRSAELYRSVIDQFNVETNARYAVNKKGEGDTYCNIFMWDVTRAMGAEIPHYVDPDTLEPRYYPDVEGATEMSANDIYDWLGKVGEKYGWYQVTAEQAQALANQGHPVITARRNDSGHGHVQVVCPSEDGTYDAERGVTIAQAGRNLLNYAYITRIYGSSTLDEVVYYAHA